MNQWQRWYSICIVPPTSRPSVQNKADQSVLWCP